MVNRPAVDCSIDITSGEMHITKVLQVHQRIHHVHQANTLSTYPQAVHNSFQIRQKYRQIHASDSSQLTSVSSSQTSTGMMHEDSQCLALHEQ